MKKPFRSLKRLISSNIKITLLRSTTKKQKTIPNKSNTPFIITALFLLQGCTALPSNSPQLQLASASQLRDLMDDKQNSIKTKITFAITDFEMSDSTNLSSSFLSQLYLASVTNNSDQSTDYLSIEYAMNESSITEIVINYQGFDNLEAINICLVSGALDGAKVLYIEDTLECKSFSLNELLQTQNQKHDFTLENTSVHTPAVTVSFNQQHTE